MSQKHPKSSATINKLVDELNPVKRIFNFKKRFIAWSIIHVLCILLIMFSTGSLRPNLIEQIKQPLFFLELLLIFVSMPLLAFLLFRESTPHKKQRPFKTILYYSPFIFSVVLISLQFFKPQFEFSMVGKRAYCGFEIILYAIPLYLSLLYLVKKAFPLRKKSLSFLMGLSASTFTSAMMNISCIYEVKHVLIWHIGPIFIVSLISFVVGLFVFKEKK